MNLYTPNKAPKNKVFYPYYFISGKMLLAFIGPDEVYKIETFGKSERITIDRCKSRKTVLALWPFAKNHKEITANELKHYFNKYLSSIIKKIISEEK